jgi:hypothetical protein
MSDEEDEEDEDEPNMHSNEEQKRSHHGIKGMNSSNQGKKKVMLSKGEGSASKL